MCVGMVSAYYVTSCEGVDSVAVGDGVAESVYAAYDGVKYVGVSDVTLATREYVGVSGYYAIDSSECSVSSVMCVGVDGVDANEVVGAISGDSAVNVSVCADDRAGAGYCGYACEVIGSGGSGVCSDGSSTSEVGAVEADADAG